MDPIGWFIHGGNGEKKGPFSTSAMEDFARTKSIKSTSSISHEKYTKGRPVDAGRIARFFNIFVESGDGNALKVMSSPTPSDPVAVSVAKREEEVDGIGRFMADGQDPSMICKLAERIAGICTENETPLYMAVQQRPIANFSPDAIVLTNRRVIVFRQKVLGRLQFVDFAWLSVADVHVSEDIIGATISIRGTNNHVEQVSFLPKSQARRVYRIAQDMEEKMVELRRQRAMEESRAGAMNVVVNNDLAGVARSASPEGANDPVSVLRTLKTLLDSGLIGQAEFDRKKAEVLERM